jgi:acyl carrier protein
MLTKSEVQSTVYAEIRGLLSEAGTDISGLTGAEPLHELGLSSLLLARLIIQLESAVGIDPFAEDVVLSDIGSVDELVALYENAAVAAA